MNGQEIELKLKIENKDEIVAKLLNLGAKLKSSKEQTDILFNSRFFDFGDKDQALRLRVEKKEDQEKAELAFKGTPTHTSDGHKVRDEFETEVNPEMTRKILDSIGFDEVAVIKKQRESYELGGLDIAIDELKFGTYLELEGQQDEIQKIRKDLGLENVEPIKQGYIFIQQEWEKKNE